MTHSPFPSPGRGAERRRGNIRTLLIVLALLLSFTASAHAQFIRGKIISVGIGGAEGTGGGLYRPGSWIPVQVRLENRSGKQFEGKLAVEQPDLDGDRALSVGPTFVLESNEVNDRIFWAYFWPRPDDDLLGDKAAILVLDKNNSVVATITGVDGRPPGSGIAPGNDGDQGRSSRFVVILGHQSMGWGSFFRAYGGTEQVRFVQINSANQIPDDAKGLDAVDAIVWQADDIKVSDLSEFEVKAILNWVRSGGHLIVSVATQGQEFLHADGPLLGVMPMTITGTRQLKLEDLSDFPGCSILRGGTDATGAVRPGNQTPFIQAIGTLKPGAHVVAGGSAGQFSEHPLVVTTAYGRGAVTMLTMDASNTEMSLKIDKPDQWIRFWDQIAGWQVGRIMTEKQVVDDAGNNFSAPNEIRLADNLNTEIDVKEVTEIRTFVAVLFLAAYWLLAGPLGHIVLRYYKVVHWSWWIFGATVIVATTIAGLVVFGLHVADTDVRHKTFLIGTVNDPEVSVVGVYGVYSPQSGELELKIKNDSPAGITYLTPLCLPTPDGLKPFADPQNYDINLEHPDILSPIFRTTLKKVEARWTGNHPGIDGSAAFTADPTKVLKGDLVNNTGYDLEDVKFVTYEATGQSASEMGLSHLYFAGAWKKGEHLTLENRLALDKVLADRRIGTVDKILEYSSWQGSSSSPMGGIMGNIAPGSLTEDTRAYYYHQRMEDILETLFDLRLPDELKSNTTNTHCEPIRGLTRLFDCTKLLRASGALIIAHAGNIDQSRFVDSPVPFSVGNRVVAGKGDVLFVYALNVDGTPPKLAPGGLIPEVGPEPINGGGPIIPDGPTPIGRRGQLLPNN